MWLRSVLCVHCFSLLAQCNYNKFLQLGREGSLLMSVFLCLMCMCVCCRVLFWLVVPFFPWYIVHPSVYPIIPQIEPKQQPEHLFEHAMNGFFSVHSRSTQCNSNLWAIKRALTFVYYTCIWAVCHIQAHTHTHTHTRAIIHSMQFAYFKKLRSLMNYVIFESCFVPASCSPLSMPLGLTFHLISMRNAK